MAAIPDALAWLNRRPPVRDPNEPPAETGGIDPRLRDEVDRRRRDGV